MEEVREHKSTPIASGLGNGLGVVLQPVYRHVELEYIAVHIKYPAAIRI
jgi:hypothetical protein